MVRCTVHRTGQVLDVQLVGSAGFQNLDQAALALLRMARLPAFPDSMNQDQVTISVPLRYELEP